MPTLITRTARHVGDYEIATESGGNFPDGHAARIYHQGLFVTCDSGTNRALAERRALAEARLMVKENPARYRLW